MTTCATRCSTSTSSDRLRQARTARAAPATTARTTCCPGTTRGAAPLDAAAGWAWRIGSSHNHFGYQNPLAAHALTGARVEAAARRTRVRDWATSLARQLEFYRWLQSAEGGIAGGATNSWGGRYAEPPAGQHFLRHVLRRQAGLPRPASNPWFGFQAWSMERVAEYYYVDRQRGAPSHPRQVGHVGDGEHAACPTAAPTRSRRRSTGRQPSLNWNATTQNWNPADPPTTRACTYRGRLQAGRRRHRRSRQDAHLLRAGRTRGRRTARLADAGEGAPRPHVDALPRPHGVAVPEIAARLQPLRRPGLRSARASAA